MKSPQRSQLPTPPAPHAPACDPGSNEDATGKGIDKDDQQEESDEVGCPLASFFVRSVLPCSEFSIIEYTIERKAVCNNGGRRL